jgi:hypothetical protein
MLIVAKRGVLAVVGGIEKIFEWTEQVLLGCKVYEHGPSVQEHRGKGSGGDILGFY